MASDYVIWDAADVPDACVVQQLEGVEDDWELAEGVSRTATFPDDATLRMDPDHPHDMMLVDNLVNTEMLIVVSGKLRASLEGRALASVEYLPVSVLDHRGKVASNEYTIVHPIDPVDCLDCEASGVEWSEMDEDCVDSIESLVLNETAVPNERSLFRVKSLEGVVLVRRELALALEQEGFTGLEWTELDEYES